MRGLLFAGALCVVLSVLVLSGRESLAQERPDCPQPVVGRYSVAATLLLPLGPTWTMRISSTEPGTYAIDIPEANVSFRSLKLERRELAGRSTNGQARISLIFDDPGGTFEGTLWLPPEVLPWKLVGTPGDRAQLIAWESYEDCLRSAPRPQVESAAAPGELETLRAQLETLQRDYAVERQRVIDAEAERTRLTALAASQQEVIQTLSTNSRATETDLTRARREVARLEQEIADLRRNAAAPASDPAAGDRVQALTAEAQDLRGRISSLEAERTDLENQVQALEARLASSDQPGVARISALEADLSACRTGNRTEELTAQLVEMDGVLQQTRGLNERLTVALSACQAPASR